MNGPRFSVALAYQPVSATEFVGFAWMGRQPPRLRFEKGGRALVVLSDGGREVRLSRADGVLRR